MLRNKNEDWEERLKDFLRRFREDNMAEYLMSEEYKGHQEKMNEKHKKIEKLGVDRAVLAAVNDLEDAENAASADYVEQAYLQGISDGIRFCIFLNQIEK